MSTTSGPLDVASRHLAEETSRRGAATDIVAGAMLGRGLTNEPDPISALSFVGIAEARPDLGENHKQIRRELVVGAEATRVLETLYS